MEIDLRPLRFTDAQLPMLQSSAQDSPYADGKNGGCTIDFTVLALLELAQRLLQAFQLSLVQNLRVSVSSASCKV